MSLSNSNFLPGVIESRAHISLPTKAWKVPFLLALAFTQRFHFCQIAHKHTLTHSPQLACNFHQINCCISELGHPIMCKNGPYTDSAWLQVLTYYHSHYPSLLVLCKWCCRERKYVASCTKSVIS